MDDDNRLDEIQHEIAVKKQEINMFDNKKPVEPAKVDKKEELVNSMFEQAVINEVATNEELRDNVTGAAREYTETKMDIIKTNVNTEKKEANFNNCKDACESYGFNEKTTPIWATKFMTAGYNVMLAIWLTVGTFTFMPVIFVFKKISVGLKHTWLAVLFSVLLYLTVTIVPILVGVLSK